MRSLGLTKSKSRHDITAKMTKALSGAGTEIEVSGQIVRLQASKQGDAKTAPWVVELSFPDNDGQENRSCRPWRAVEENKEKDKEFQYDGLFS